MRFTRHSARVIQRDRQVKMQPPWENIEIAAQRDAKRTTVCENNDNYDKLQFSNRDSGISLFESSNRDEATISKNVSVKDDHRSVVTEAPTQTSTSRLVSKRGIPPPNRSKSIVPSLSPSVDDFRKKQQLLKEFHDNRRILWYSKLICLLPIVFLNIGIALAGFIQGHDFAFYF